MFPLWEYDFLALNQFGDFDFLILDQLGDLII